MNVSRLKFPSLIVAVGLLLGLIADLLLYDNPLGISVPLIAFALLAALLTMTLVEKRDVVWPNLALAVPLLFFAAMSAIRAEQLLRFLNISSALLLIILLAGNLAGRPLTALNLGGYLKTLITGSLWIALGLPVPLLRRGFDDLRQREGRDGLPVRSLLIGMAIALPFLCIFTILFSSADLLFSKYLTDILGEFTLGKLIGHSLLTLTLSWLAIGLLGYALVRRPKDHDTIEDEASVNTDAQDDSPAIKLDIRSLLKPLESFIVLFSIDLLFLAFVGIQFAALFGGEKFLQSQGLTYSEYARSGFFELLAVSLMTLGLILALDYVTRRESRRARITFLLGSAAMIVMTIVMLASSFQRLQLYELAFGFTTLRLYTHIFIVWLAMLLAAFLLLLTTARVRLFATAALLVWVGYLSTLNVVNPDVFILQQNLLRYENGETLDVDYLGQGSADALPELFALAEDVDPRLLQELREREIARLPISEDFDTGSIDSLSDMDPQLLQQLSDQDTRIGLQAGSWLHRHLDRLDRRQDDAGWPSYHFSINRAYSLLDDNRELIQSFPAAPWYAYHDHPDE